MRNMAISGIVLLSLCASVNTGLLWAQKNPGKNLAGEAPVNKNLTLTPPQFPAFVDQKLRNIAQNGTRKNAAIPDLRNLVYAYFETTFSLRKIKKGNYDEDSFESLLLYYLLLGVRTDGDFVKNLDERQKWLNYTNSPKINYVYGLGCYLRAYRSGGSYSEALSYLGKSLKQDPKQVEALWVRSQIYAENGELELLLQDLEKINENMERFDPLLYLYDQEIIEAIKSSVKVNLGL